MQLESRFSGCKCIVFSTPCAQLLALVWSYAMFLAAGIVNLDTLDSSVYMRRNYAIASALVIHLSRHYRINNVRTHTGRQHLHSSNHNHVAQTCIVFKAQHLMTIVLFNPRFILGHNDKRKLGYQLCYFHMAFLKCK